jgi:glyoxylase-like metal-dependent hydrolase (beta-lactamase superfamily II)
MRTWITNNGTLICRIISGRSNVFLIKNQAVAILVDTSPARKWGLLQKRLLKMGVRNLDFLILTHTHFDHAANAWQLREKYNARIVVHISEQKLLEAGKNNIPEGTNLLSGTLIRVFRPFFESWFDYNGVKADRP